MYCQWSLVFYVGFVQPSSVWASGFLARLPESEMRRVMLAKLTASFAGTLQDVDEKRIKEIDEGLRITFDVLPKNINDRLDHNGVRYLMNRFFVQQHGWSITNFQVTGSTSNNISASTGSSRLPDILQELFETLISSHGSTLAEVVALTATLEHLIHEDLRSVLVEVYKALQVPVEGEINKIRALNAMELYTICVLRGQELQDCLDNSAELQRSFFRYFARWGDLKRLIREALRDAIPAGGDSFSFDNITKALEFVADRFASFYESTCEDLRSSLFDMEESRSGRVRLIDFYNAALHQDQHNLVEPIELLRDTGALDEVDAQNPRVIIPNYVIGKSNCVARTSFYSTCCPNTCEPVLAQIEQTLGSGTAAPADIVSAVDATRSVSLSPLHLQRLHEVAKQHGGRVRLHGRLFMQWLHFVYPRDCAYPHRSGSTYEKTLEDWGSDMGQHPQLTRDELKNATLRLSELKPVEGKDSSCMWTLEEELFIERLEDAAIVDAAFSKSRFSTSWSNFVVALALMAIVAAFANRGGVLQKRTRRSSREAPSETQYFC
eukprot:TRINITY_DN2511_c0_g1_i1.p1 TRINITY_DN2511_c0_g1~~TRINITY_DN2511_c0_g1_i1.p1  ORF type:complete len:550 (-),score=101.37 TRINITY_DN2511_c0_g1_i1:164-1813(-)